MSLGIGVRVVRPLWGAVHCKAPFVRLSVIKKGLKGGVFGHVPHPTLEGQRQSFLKSLPFNQPEMIGPTGTQPPADIAFGITKTYQV